MVFQEKVTDEQILEAVKECLEDATVPANCIAKKLGISTRRARERLILLEKDNKLLSRKIGTGFGFRPLQ